MVKRSRQQLGRTIDVSRRNMSQSGQNTAGDTPDGSAWEC